MKNAVLLLSTFFLTTITSIGQNAVWKKTDEKSLSQLPKSDRASMPSEFVLFTLDFQNLKNRIQNAPLDLSRIDSNVIMSFPNPEGELQHYKIFEAPVVAKGLSDKFPDLKSFIGKGIDDPTATIRFSVTIFGLHAMTLSGNSEMVLIDTFTKDLNNYIVYYKSKAPRTKDFDCKVKSFSKNSLDNFDSTPRRLKMSDSNFRVFRLAMACTIEYAAFHVNAAQQNNGTLQQKKAAVLAAMNVTMTRVNGLFERDMSMRLTLIANNDEIIFITSDNFTNDDSLDLLDESQTQITNIIGSANFDIGHTVSTGGGGVASPSPCEDDYKASGITGLSSPVGDAYDVDYVIHEMGHQFGANHTYRNSCGNNVNPATAVEPGSGSTIMAYAGICAPNVQNNSDAYFHTVSLDEMEDLVLDLNCPVITPNNNAAPVANAGLDYTIPKSTPFLLKGSATDTNQAALTYCWEQTNNNAAVQPPVPTATVGVSSRSFLPTASPNRYMPKLATVIGGSLSSTWEVTSSVARTLNYTLTVRDNSTLLGGQTGKDKMVITVNGTAGPFSVTSQNAGGIVWVGNSAQTVTWNVAGTTANNINTALVNILLSTDNGLTFPTTILANTPNDGSETITAPANVMSSNNCRIMVQAVGNIFYAVNNTNFALNTPLSNSSTAFQNFSIYPNPNDGSFQVSFDTDAAEQVLVSINDIQGRNIFNETFKNNGLFEHAFQLNNLQSGIYVINIVTGENQMARKIIIE